jgi:hypothetical protein
MNIQMYANSLEGQMFRKSLFRNINLRRVFFVPGSLVIVTPIIAAVARAIFSRVARVFVVSRGFRRRSALSAIFSLDQLREVKETDVRKIKEQKFHELAVATKSSKN